MYYPSLFAPVSPAEAPPRDPLDLSAKRAPDDMLDHRKLAALAPPLPYRLAYDPYAHPLLASYLQQQRDQAAFYARYADPLHLRNGLTQREAAAALAATRGLYAPPALPPAPMVLPAFSLYGDDKGAFTALRGEKGFLDAARYSEHLQRLREQHLHGAKCACCAAVGQACQCCVQAPSQAALCARSPMGCSSKEPASAATGKVCDFPLGFLHRPTATTSSSAATTASELKLSVSSLCATQAEPATVSSRDKQHAGFRAPIWNAGLPTASTAGKTAFSVPKKKDHKDGHSKEHRSSGSIKDILKDNPANAPDVKPDVRHSSAHDGSRRASEKYSSLLNDEFSRYDSSEGASFNYYKNSVIKSTSNSSATQNASVKEHASRENGTLPSLKMPPLLEAVRPSELHPTVDQSQNLSASVHSPQGPPPLIAVSSSSEPSQTSVIKSSHAASDSSMRMYSAPTSTSYKHHTEKPSENAAHKSSSSKSPKKAPKYGGLPMPFVNGDLPLAYPKPLIPPKPMAHMPSHLSSTYASHYRPSEDWLPYASPNVTVAAMPPPASSSTSTTTASSRSSKSQHQREPDYADTANVLQSLLIRSAPGIEALPLSSKAQEAALMSSASLPLFSLDYRYPLGPQLKLTGGRDGLPLCGPLTAQSGSDPVTPSKSSREGQRPESNNYASTLVPKQKKRPNPSQEESPSAKKLATDYNVPVPRYSFQAGSFTSEASEAPECPYTFVAEPPFNFARKPHEGGNKPLWREATEPAKSPVLAPPKPAEEAPRLLARIRRQRARIATDLRRQLSVRAARRLLSRYTLRWAHRRYLHKWHALRLRRRGDRQPDQPSAKTKESLSMPPEMKRLMVNKALGETPLHRAARLGYPEAVAYCLQSGCVGVNARDNAGYTPLHECCSRGHLDIARALLQYGADVDASAAGGIRPLHDAVENDHVEVVRLLLSYGADPTLATYSGLEPLKLARSPLMAEFLRGFLADAGGSPAPPLPWRFWGSAACLDPAGGGCALFEGLPPDPPADDAAARSDFLFEVSDAPHLPTFRLTHRKTQCNYLRLGDVLRRLDMSRADFSEAYGHIEVVSLPRHEFEASVTCSPLLSGADPPPRAPDATNTTELVRLDSSIRKVLGIETISVR